MKEKYLALLDPFRTLNPVGAKEMFRLVLGGYRITGRIVTGSAAAHRTGLPPGDELDPCGCNLKETLAWFGLKCAVLFVGARHNFFYHACETSP